jgi:hypothetical protein
LILKFVPIQTADVLDSWAVIKRTPISIPSSRLRDEIKQGSSVSVPTAAPITSRTRTTQAAQSITVDSGTEVLNATPPNTTPPHANEDLNASPQLGMETPCVDLKKMTSKCTRRLIPSQFYNRRAYRSSMYRLLLKYRPSRSRSLKCSRMLRLLLKYRPSRSRRCSLKCSPSGRCRLTFFQSRLNIN